MYALPLEPPSHCPHPILLVCHTALHRAPWILQQLPASYLWYAWSCVYVQYYSPLHLLLPPLCPQVHSLCLHLRCSSFKLGKFRMYSIVHQYFPMKLQRITAYKHGGVSKTFPASVPHPHHIAEQAISSLWALLPGSLLGATILCRPCNKRRRWKSACRFKLIALLSYTVS